MSSRLKSRMWIFFNCEKLEQIPIVKNNVQRDSKGKMLGVFFAGGAVQDGKGGVVTLPNRVVPIQKNGNAKGFYDVNQDTGVAIKIAVKLEDVSNISRPTSASQLPKDCQNARAVAAFGK